MSEGYTLEEGQVWRDRRDPQRTVTITGTFDAVVRDRRGEQVGTERYVDVRRNTSRRRQAMKMTTLLAKYRR